MIMFLMSLVAVFFILISETNIKFRKVVYLSILIILLTVTSYLTIKNDEKRQLVNFTDGKIIGDKGDIYYVLDSSGVVKGYKYEWIEVKNKNYDYGEMKNEKI